MGLGAPNVRKPHYFLHRTFLGDQDLLIIFNTKHCRYKCHFCQLPVKCSLKWIPTKDILMQFEYVMREMKHSLSVLDRVTFSNEGSILDTSTFPSDALITIASCIKELRVVKRLYLETRVEFIDPIVINQIKNIAPNVVVGIITGFETIDSYIRDKILCKNEPLDTFLYGLDRIAETRSELTAYVLFKPSPMMSDEEAFIEAEKSIDYLIEQCSTRSIAITIRLNPMYAASGSKWARIAHKNRAYKPPRLTDVMKLAEKKAREGVSVYIGLSYEGINEPDGIYTGREDYSPRLIKPIKLFNDRKLFSFNGII